MKHMPPSRLKKLSLGKPIKLSAVTPLKPTWHKKKAGSMSVFFSLSVMLLAGVSPAFVVYASRLMVVQAPPVNSTHSTPLPLKAVGTPVSELPPTRTATPGPTIPLADYFDVPVAFAEDWVVHQDFSTVYNPVGGGWHTGEDWVLDPELLDRWGQRIWAAGQPVQSTAAGWVRYARITGYPCGVVILQHTLPNNETVYSVYSHIEALTVEEEAPVDEGQVLGQICAWPGDISNSHLHFEIRTFYLTDHVNGENSACRFRHKNFPPGPGYWPICGSYRDEMPTDEGWLDPSDFIRVHSPTTLPDSTN